MTKIIVSKFGGSSMADAVAMKRSAGVALEHSANLVTVSATYGTTNNLIKLSELALNSTWEECEVVINEIVEKHHSIARDLELVDLTELESLLSEVRTISKGINLLRDCSAKAFDAIQSLGERMSSLLFTRAMEIVWNGKKPVENFDVRRVLRTDDQFGKAQPLIGEIRLLCDEHLAKCKTGEVVYVTQGFIGQNEEGHTTTLGRGGSDYSAALLAEGLGADILQIWTDVAGIATTDPRIVPSAKLMSEITFSEAAELATFGAKILHPTTLTPALREGISVYVGSSYEPLAKGTWIRRECSEAPLIRAMALKKDQSLLTLSTPKMLHSHGFLYEIFKIFNQHKISVDSITTSEISVSLTIEDSTLLNKKLITELETLATVNIEENLCLVSLIGNNINHTAGLAGQIFNALGDINVRMICLGASKHNFCFLVDEARANDAVKELHHHFIGA
ncbi:lysine-sensitive aspartokinase 3 [Halobacteriovorax sp. JY17]|uniref:lysine-sensitive aspartokinase 3 n=1 Tax=Halobacteriovorax sp. JY17 TaxID=2014617 RepID=UPI000C471E18|nr:lysine-sensitive aspartokinase 3 [Halobacteriovorax sp. JY17]PIK15722.1 MAG: lysine-sensitive aspartokinase 3 [Halobacteriovorax sp. JY17]